MKPKINYYLSATIIAFFIIATMPTASASWLKDNVNKAGKWVSKQTGVAGVKKDAQAAANQAEAAAKEAQDQISKLAPNVDLAAEAVKDTTEEIKSAVALVKWPAFCALSALTLWLLSLARGSMKRTAHLAHRADPLAA